MSYLVLARKYRPQSFSEVTGQGHVTTALTNAVIRDRVPHALLFSGPRGVGKTSCARILAKVLNCTGRDLKEGEIAPCGKCSNCIDITRGNNLAVVEIDGASNNSVEDVRTLIETLYTSPPPGIAYKMYIIDEVHMLSTSAFNALLKSIEEPPPNTIFILATTESHKIPDTVRSRCQEHTFKRLLVSDIVNQLNTILTMEGLTLDKEVVQILARTADGGMRDASSLLDRILSLSTTDLSTAYVAEVLGTLDSSYFMGLIEDFINESEDEAIEKVSFAFNRGLDIRAYLSDFVATLRLTFLFSLAKRRGEKSLQRFVELEELSDIQVEKLHMIVESKDADYFSLLFDMGREIAEVCVRSEFAQAVMEAGVVKLCFCRNVLNIKNQLAGRTISSASPVAHKISRTPVVNNSKAEENLDSEDEDNDQEISNSGPLNWTSFLSFLKDKGELLLVTYLNRVAPVDFFVSGENGVLSVKGMAFVIDNFKDKSMLDTLKTHLGHFSRVHSWKVSFQEAVSEESSINPAVKSSHIIQGSNQAMIEDKKRNVIKKIDDEARNADAVKTMLEVFEGSKIERIVPDTGK